MTAAVDAGMSGQCADATAAAASTDELAYTVEELLSAAAVGHLPPGHLSLPRREFLHLWLG